MSDTTINQPAPGGRPVRPALLRKLCGGEAMAALGAGVAHLVGMGSADDRGTRALAGYVLADAVRARRILRLANALRLRTASGTAVTTIARAISLLGFDNVKTNALAMLLADAMAGSLAAAPADGAAEGWMLAVRTELEAALCVSLAARELARRSPYPNAEEAAIAALFKNLGPLLAAAHEYARYREVAALAANGKTPAEAARMILGCGWDALSQAVLGAWGIPDEIVRDVGAPPDGVLPAATDRGDWMRQAAAFGLDVARLLARTVEPSAAPEAQALLERYGAAMGLDAARLDALFETVAQELAALLRSMDLRPVPRLERRDGKDKDGLPNVLPLASLDAGEPEGRGSWPSGKPHDALALLEAGVQEVGQMRASGRHKANEIILAVLETLHGALGFGFSAVVLKDMRAAQFRARVSIGADERVRDGFAFPAAAGNPPDIFHLALDKDADLVISDANSPKIRDLLPPWHARLRPGARSFILLPLVVGRAQLGLFYADRPEPAPEGMAPEETELIKALKGQVLAALAPAAPV